MTNRTAAQKRARDKIVFDAFIADCPTRHVLATIGDKWSALVICALVDGPRRHGELRGRIAGVSQKMLTQTLRTLERDGLLTRTVTPSVPVRVDYELTELGRTLLPVLGAMKRWSEANIRQILAARAGYDDDRTAPGAADPPRPRTVTDRLDATEVRQI